MVLIQSKEEKWKEVFVGTENVNIRPKKEIKSFIWLINYVRKKGKNV